MEVGYVNAVSDQWLDQGNAVDITHIGRAHGQRDWFILYRRVYGQRFANNESSSNWIGECDDTWSEHGACYVHGLVGATAHSVRGNNVGVRHLDVLPGGAWRERHAAGVHECWNACGQPDGRLLCHCSYAEWHDTEQCGGDGFGERECTWLEPRLVDVHGVGEDWANGV